MSIAAFGMKQRPGKGPGADLYPKPREQSLSPRRSSGKSRSAAAANPAIESSGQPIALAVHHSLEAAAAQWQAFEADAWGTLYQSYLWCRAWMETAGVAVRVRPVIVTGHDSSGRMQFLLPLQLRRTFGVAILEWLGAPHGNYGHGLFRPAFLPEARQWFDVNWQAVLDVAGPYDAVSLREMPMQLQGQPHPMAGCFNLRGPNRSYAMVLAPDFVPFYAAKRSGEDRRAARKKEKALAQIGTVEFGLPSGKPALHATLDTMFRQQESRLAERGVHGVFGPVERAFIHRLADLQDESTPVLLPYELKLNGEPLAILLGGRFCGTYWALISSLAATNLRRMSPGDLALRRTVEACCQTGLSHIDFSSGDSRYKQSWADDVIDLHALLAGRTFKGLAYAGIRAAGLILKRSIKDSPALLALANALRRKLRGS